MPENRYDYTQPKTGNKSNKQLNPNVLRNSWSTMGWRQNYWHACERRMNELFEHCKSFCLQIILACNIVILQKNVVLSEKGKYKLVSNFRDFLQHFVFKVSCEQIMFCFCSNNTFLFRDILDEIFEMGKISSQAVWHWIGANMLDKLEKNVFDSYHCC